MTGVGKVKHRLFMVTLVIAIEVVAVTTLQAISFGAMLAWTL